MRVRRFDWEMTTPKVTNFEMHRRPELELIFSSRDGYVWVTLPAICTVRLGPQEDVADMMRDFLAQDALGKQFAMRYSAP